MCMIVCVWLCDNARMMLSWRSQDNIQLVTTCNPQWLHMCEFMLVACHRFINNVVNSRTELWTQKCATWTLAHYVFVLLFMGTRHIPVCNIIAWLYVYVCICMIVCVWLYDNVGMMPWWRTQDHIHLVTACHPTWLHLYQFMLVEIPGKVPEGSNADTLLSSGGSAAHPGPASFTIVQHHCMLVCEWLYTKQTLLNCWGFTFVYEPNLRHTTFWIRCEWDDDVS